MCQSFPETLICLITIFKPTQWTNHVAPDHLVIKEYICNQNKRLHANVSLKSKNQEYTVYTALEHAAAV